LIVGHRRYAAAKLLGWTEIAALVRDETDDQA
jgi:ParB-like chromosome segregation protein Spo0J